MKTYKIPYQYTAHGTVNIEAKSFEEARELALKLPTDTFRKHYLSDSFEIDEERISRHNPED